MSVIDPRATQVVEEYLKSTGMKVADRHWASGGGFLDVVAVDRDTLVAVAIVTRIPAELPDTARVRLRKLAVDWMSEHGVLHPRLRVDLAQVTLLPHGQSNLEYAKGMG